ncbi:hypothetical protein DQ04_01641060 [Trypanosoma grayi]|uniref:hypothetical protein n=1 Tax=Trypanosoma grayi TaxID=71804 RepID=UPI0004F48D58|nr:hypothetical protein DQ04_01641060 [Trypanosoma grayi]KEG12527.1 hypothetical protein DQ04_01641060 [Trypanosoma grayi]
MLPPPPWLPFIEYVLMALEHPPNMFVSKLAACCTMLFLTRSDPDMLRTLCHKWAIRFSMDRGKLIAQIRCRAERSRSFPICRATSVDKVRDIPQGPKLCDPDACVEHFLKLVNTLVPLYFSWNWHRTSDVIRVNKEYEEYVRETLLPFCASTSAEADVSDGEETVSLLPLEAPGSSIAQLLSPADSVLSNGCTPRDIYSGPFRTPRLTFATLGNLLERMRRSPDGTVLLFHAKFSAKSCEALSIFQDILAKELLNPVPTVCIVHAVAEPELANMYNIRWFPTIIYVPPVGDEGNCGVAMERYTSVCTSEKSFALSSMRVNESPSFSKVHGRANHAMSVSGRLSQGGAGLSPSNLLYGLASDTDTPFSLTLNVSEQSDEEELVGMIEQGLHRVYPENCDMTSASLVEWINSKGTKILRGPGDFDAVNRINVLREEAKFKKYRDLISAVVMLRQLQCSAENCPSPTGEAPVFIFLGGGMAAGKSTAATALSRSSWWAKHKANSVLVNADDFKTAVTPLSYMDKSTHESSTRAAENLMVQALNQGRSIVFDSTMMWRPFVKQVIDMVRNAHTTLYCQGVGYRNNGATEEYFRPTGPRLTPLPKPYEVRLLAITVKPETAVPRGILRMFSTGRGVPIPMQLRSFRLFSENFAEYLRWVDSATLYNNNVFVNLEKGELPPVIAEKSEEGLVIHDEDAYAQFLGQQFLNEEADNNLELYPVASEMR